MSLRRLKREPIANLLMTSLRSNPILAKQKQPAVPQPTHVQASEAFEYDDVSGEEEEGVSYVYDSEDEFDESEGDVVYEEGAYEDVLDVGPEMFLRPPDPSAPTAPPVTRPPLAEDPQRLVGGADQSIFPLADFCRRTPPSTSCSHGSKPSSGRISREDCNVRKCSRRMRQHERRQRLRSDRRGYKEVVVL